MDILTSTFISIRSRLHSIAVRIAGEREADDVVNETFCNLWAKRLSIDDETEAAKLSYTVVRNQAIDALRRTQVRNIVSMPDSSQFPDIPDSDDDSDTMQTYNSVVSLSRRLLPDRQYLVFEMHDIQGMEYPEIAQALGLSPENVRMILSRARKLIREYYRNKKL